MKKYLIKEVYIVNEGKITYGDILIDKGKIIKISSSIAADKNSEVINANGLYVLPGMIDDQVHFREPGMTYKGDIESESMAAVMGGITSYMEMPNCSPPTTNIKNIIDKKNIAKYKSHANYSFYLGAANDNQKEILKIKPNDVCGIKIFMGSSTGNMLVDNIKTLEYFFRNSPTVIATHCEDTPLIEKNEKYFRRRFGENIPFNLHSKIRSREACLRSSNLAVDLAKKFDSRLHVLHITSKEEIGLFTQKIPIEDKKITAEACVHHLFFSEKDYEIKKGLIKCNPSIKEEYDRIALLNGINNNYIDVVATDHAPHTWQEKIGDYFACHAGLPLVQHALLSLIEHYFSGLLSLEKIVEKTSHNPAIVYKVKERGFIREGYWADLVLINLNFPNKIQNINTKYKCGWNPFHGETFNSKIEKTFVNGILKYDEDKIVSDNLGRVLDFKHNF